SAPTELGLRLRLLEVLAVWPYLNEVNVTRGRLTALDRIGVGCARVVGKRIAWSQAEFFQVDSVTGRNFVERLRAAEELHGFLFAAIDRVDQFELLDAEIVGRAGLHEQFFNRGRHRIPPGLGERHSRRAVRCDIDGVLRRSLHLLAMWSFEFDAIETLLVD